MLMDPNQDPHSQYVSGSRTAKCMRNQNPQHWTVKGIIRRGTVPGMSMALTGSEGGDGRLGGGAGPDIR